MSAIYEDSEMKEEIKDETDIIKRKIPNYENKGKRLSEQGQFGEVFALGKDRVLKIVKFHKIGRNAFFDEVRLTIRAEEQGYGPSDVKYGEGDTYGFITMKRGTSLSELLIAAQMGQIETMFPKILAVLSLMHKHGVFHQDTNAGNFIIDKTFRVIDYGSAIQCGRDITGTVAAAYDIIKAAMQIIEIRTEEDVEISHKKMSLLTRLLDAYWDQESFVFIRESVFRFTRASKLADTKKLQPDTITKVRYDKKGAILFTRKLFEQIPSIKPKSDLDLTSFLQTKLIATMNLEDDDDDEDVNARDIMTEGRHERESQCIIL